MKTSIGFYNTAFPAHTPFTKTIPSLSGGDGKSLLDLVTHIDSDKYDCTIISLGNEKNVQVESPNEHLRLYRYPRFGININNMNMLKKIISLQYIFDSLQFSFDLIHCQLGFPGSEIASLNYCRKKEVPLILSIRGAQKINWGSKKRRILMKLYVDTLFSFAIKKSDVIVVPTQGFLDDFPILQSYIDKIHVVPNGVDFEIFSKYNGKKKDMSVYLDGFQQYDNILLFVGNLVEGKGIKTLLDSFEMVLKEYPSTGLIIVGSGPLERLIVETSKRGNYSKKIHLTGFIAEQEKLAKIYSYSDLFVFPSLSETFGRVLLESMAAGTPCLVSNIGALMSVIDNGSVGLYADVNQPANFANEIIRFFEMSETQKNSLSIKGIAYAKQHRWKNVARKMEEIYEALL